MKNLLPMKHIVRWALACIASLCLVSCSSVDAATEEVPVAQSQAASSSHTAVNGSTSIPWNANQFCHAYWFQGGSGHAGSPTWPNGVAKHGARFGAFPPSISAFPYSIPSGGVAIVGSRCDDKADFGITGGDTSDSSPPYLLWSTSSGQNVGGFTALWSEQAFCYLNGIVGLSHANEDVFVMPPQGAGNWVLAASGYSTLGASAKCVHPNRSWNLTGALVAQSGQTVAGPSVGNSVCFFTRVKGNLDDGAAFISISSNQWQLTANGVLAEMRCALF